MIANVIDIMIFIEIFGLLYYVQVLEDEEVRHPAIARWSLPLRVRDTVRYLFPRKFTDWIE